MAFLPLDLKQERPIRPLLRYFGPLSVTLVLIVVAAALYPFTTWRDVWITGIVAYGSVAAVLLWHLWLILFQPGRLLSVVIAVLHLPIFWEVWWRAMFVITKTSI